MRFRPVTDGTRKPALLGPGVPLSLLADVCALINYASGGPTTAAVNEVTMTYTDTTAIAVSSRLYRVQTLGQ